MGSDNITSANLTQSYAFILIIMFIFYEIILFETLPPETTFQFLNL